MLLTFISKRKETKGVCSFRFKSDESFVWQAGQYMFYTLPNKNPDNRGVTRYFTISSAPFEKFIMLTTRISLPPSSFKKSLLNLKTGEKVEVSGPDGNFIVGDPNKNYVFIAGGIGITPFRSILLELNHKNKQINVQLLYANRDRNPVFKGELEALIKKNRNFKINYFISPSRINDKILSSIINHKSSIINFSFYISGPEPFVESIEKILKGLGVKPLNIKLDFFPRYETGG